ncbi:MAG: helix-turn-helix domain-containing protein [Candidatus Aminicenantales bacterium]|jgi:transcriptional regulator with PAS, ATPase and Fis domain
MEKKFSDLNIHQKLELVIREMVEKELSLKDVLREFEKIFFEQTAKKYEGNKTKMAKALGIHRNTLQNRAKALKIKKRY